MGIEKLKRVIWRARERNPGLQTIRRKEMELAIMLECGTHESTIRETIKQLKKLGWIKLGAKRYQVFWDKVDST